MSRLRDLIPSVVLTVLISSCGGEPTSSGNQSPTIIEVKSGTSSPLGTTRTTTITCSARDPDGDALSYAWSSSPGTFLSGIDESAVTWQAPGVPCECTVSVTVSDGRLATTASVVISVKAVPVPSLAIDPPAGTTATTFTFDASGSEDLETPKNELEVRWNIDSVWGPWDTNKLSTHRFDEGGTKEIVLEVRDSDGLVASKDSTIIVTALPFVIENLGVSFEPLDTETHYAGDFYFSPYVTKVFWEFGARVRDEQGNIKELPHFTYVVRKDASVLAVSEGEVIAVWYQAETNDYELAIRSLNDSSYDVSYDHVTSPRVTVGDRVQPGDVLGNPRGWPDQDVGDIEIMVINRDTQMFYCPFCCFNEATAEEYEQKVSRLVSEWEEFKGDNTIHDEENWVKPGCRYESMPAF